MQYTTGSAPAYQTTAAGVVTSFSHLADSDGGMVRALLFTRITPTSFQLVGKSAPQSVAPSTLNSFQTRIPVPAGALLGAQYSSVAMSCSLQAVSSFDEVRAGSYDPDSSSTMTTTGSYASRLNISAVIEPDTDGDGYGDVTQDLCPSLATTQAACSAAPDTAVTKAPKKRSAKRKATFAFTRTVPGSTFTCKVDKKAAKPCASPYKKKLKYGKHTVVITAVGPSGTADPTPVTVKFKIKKPQGRRSGAAS